MKFRGLSTESTDMLTDVLGSDEYDASADVATEPVETGVTGEDTIATEAAKCAAAKGGKPAPKKGSKPTVPAKKGGKPAPKGKVGRESDDAAGAAAEGEPSGETSENVIEDQDALDLSNGEGGEYDASEASTESDDTATDAVDDAFSAIDESGSAPAEAGEGAAEGDTEEGGEEAGEGAVEEAGEGAAEGDTEEGGETATTEEQPSEDSAVATETPVESTDTDGELTDEQVTEASQTVESFFDVIERRSKHSFEDGETSILDEPEVAEADLPVVEGAVEETVTTEVPVEGSTTEMAGDAASDAAAATVPATDGVAEEVPAEQATDELAAAESFFDIF